MLIFIGYIGGSSNPDTSTDIRQNVNSNVSYDIEYQQVNCRSQDGFKGVFSRNRKINFKTLLAMIMTFKSSIQRELDDVFRLACDESVPLRQVSKGAFTQARAKLDPQVFVNLNKTAITTFYDGADFYTWSGMRLLAIDSTSLTLPNHESNHKTFNTHNFGPKADSMLCKAKASIVYDALNQLVIDAHLAPFAHHDLQFLPKHFEVFKPCDLVLMDRAYSAIWVFFALMARQVNFCIRLKENWFLEAKSLLNSLDISRIVEFELPQNSHDKLSDFPEWINKKIKCRLVKVELENGEYEVVCTSLLDENEHPNSSFKELYHQRWQEEEAFKNLKSKMNLEQFSGKTERAVLQDFYAKLFTLTLCSIYSFPVQERLKAEDEAEAQKRAENNSSKSRKHERKINYTNVISKTYYLIRAHLIKDTFTKVIGFFDQAILKTCEIVRPNRSNPRPKYPKRAPSPNIKPL